MTAAENPTGVKVTVNLTVESELDSCWIEFVTGSTQGYGDIFMRDGHCGYWMMGIKHDPQLGWLAFEHGAEDRIPSKEEDKAAIKAWKAGEALPKHYHALNLELAKKGWAEGIKRQGVNWYESADGNDYDNMVQYALLGQLVYG